LRKKRSDDWEITYDNGDLDHILLGQEKIDREYNERLKEIFQEKEKEEKSKQELEKKRRARDHHMELQFERQKAEIERSQSHRKRFGTIENMTPKLREYYDHEHYGRVTKTFVIKSITFEVSLIIIVYFISFQEPSDILFLKI